MLRTTVVGALVGLFGCEPETTVDDPLDGGAITDAGAPDQDGGSGQTPFKRGLRIE